ncbi:hypothetical protein HYY70_02425, partial [Candidatus Woesearchaeota archaeon]|nr:hypothetical protein [Candidatus Woesearchaeota archaeon]
MLKKLVILLVMIVLLVPFTLSFDLSNFPLPFFPHPCTNVYWLIGSSLADDEPFRIINGKFFIGFVPENAPYCGPEPSSGFLDSEFGSEKYKKQNILSIGGPCANKVTAQIMSIPTSWPECATGFENGTGRIILFNKWNKTQLIVAGYGAEDTKRAAKVLTNYESYSFNGTMIDITNKNGTLNVYEVYEIDPRKVPLNSLIIDFNNAGKNGLIASTQTNFTNHFQSEINKLALDYGLIKSIE